MPPPSWIDKLQDPMSAVHHQWQVQLWAYYNFDSGSMDKHGNNSFINWCFQQVTQSQQQPHGFRRITSTYHNSHFALVTPLPSTHPHQHHPQKPLVPHKRSPATMASRNTFFHNIPQYRRPIRQYQRLLLHRPASRKHG